MRQKEGSTEAILREEAIKLIVQQGFDGFSMSKLAKASNLSVAAIYIYYKNKEELLNRLFNYVQASFSSNLLTDFSIQLPFKEGLWILWKNYLRFILENPVHFNFFDLFRNSHLINHEQIEESAFNRSIEEFARRAINKGEIEGSEPELFWSLAFGPLNALIRFHFEKRNVYTKEDFQINEDNLKRLFDRVLTAFIKK